MHLPAIMRGIMRLDRHVDTLATLPGSGPVFSDNIDLVLLIAIRFLFYSDRMLTEHTAAQCH